MPEFNEAAMKQFNQGLIKEFRANGGKVLSGPFVNAPLLLLTTTGAKSGALRTQVLPYTDWERSYVVVGSNGGGPKDPGWVHNVRADGSAWVRVKGRRVRGTRRIG